MQDAGTGAASDDMSGAERLDGWRRKVAAAIVEAERPAMEDHIRQTDAFRAEKEEIFRLVGLLDPPPVGPGPHEGYAAISRFVIGYWDSGPNVWVVEMPSGDPIPEAEEALAALGEILADGQCCLFMSFGPAFNSAWRLVWCQDKHETDISAPSGLGALHLDIRTRQAMERRAAEISAAVSSGRLPPPPWVANQEVG
ncbi:hypothetical protein [Nitrospirillum sp. BR 11163]|uniref:hypothetical protein n=1 Tax=Nitrospirillum sp. BR 11163 TaxID=3104323 RepID=UPI002AFE48FC|nr:hypothetical protein [Nitrospirillum sp. BR 11163]MEA1675464.1 hypothetical protein [Nitrospirillum sp. BR 11163]